MKKLLTVMCLAVFVWSCTKKATPTKSETPASNVGGVTGGNNNSGSGNASMNNTPPPQTNNVNDAKTLTPSATTQTPEVMAQIEGQKTFNAKCGRCHGLKVTTDYTDVRWVQIMQVMATKANLTATEKDNVLAYVRANCKK